MIRIPLPFSDSALLLTLRWQEMSGLGRAGMVLFCLLIPVLLVMLYRYEMRLIRRRTAGVLLTLRLVVVCFLLFVVYLQPIVARSKTEELQGRVLLAIDRSDSMKVADPQRPIADKLRLARALKLTGELPAELVETWARQLESKPEPTWVEASEFPDQPDRRRQVEQERRKLFEQAIQRVDRLSRLGVVQRLLETDGAGLIDAIARKHKIELVTFARETGEIKVEQLSELLQPFAEVRPSGPKEAEKPEQRSDDSTDLRLPLARTLERSGKAEGKILGVVLLTDGQHNRRDSDTQTPVAKALELAQQEIPLYPIAIGDRRAPPDIAIASVRAPSAVFKDVNIPVEARIKISGVKRQEVVVDLKVPGRDRLTERIAHDGVDRYYNVTFQVKADQLGMQTLTVTARPVEGEIRVDNNSRPLSVNVADDKARVLLVDGEARWEFHYLASALARDKTMQVQSIVFLQPRLGRIPEEELEKIGNPRQQWPADPDALAGFDCIVLGDVSPTQFPLAERERLEKYVADRGGTLVILAGKRSMPLGFLNAADAVAPRPAPAAGKDVATEKDPLLRLLPILEPHVVRPTKGFAVTLTQQGKLANYLLMEAGSEESVKRWADLPPHFWGVIGKAKPGATPLAYVTLHDQGLPAEPGSADQDPARNHALIVRQNYGFGRVLYVGLESTWRWRYKTGDTYHHRFWGQVIRWAAADKPLVAGNEHLRFGTREPTYQQGSEIDLVVRLSESLKPLGANALAAARLIRIEGDDKETQAATVQLGRRAAQPRVLEGRAPPYLPPGQYVIELAIPELSDKLTAPPGPDGKPAKLRAPFTVLPVDSEEMIELATNFPLLEELAVKSDGKLFTPENAGELVELLTKKTVSRERDVENKLWEDWLTLVLFLLLVTSEWVIRKLAGLP